MATKETTAAIVAVEKQLASPEHTACVPHLEVARALLGDVRNRLVFAVRAHRDSYVLEADGLKQAADKLRNDGNGGAADTLLAQAEELHAKAQPLTERLAELDPDAA